MIDSWKKLPISQQPEYQNIKELHNICNELSKKPSIVFDKSIKKLSSKLNDVYEKKSFILQIGPCAETFEDNNEKTLSKMAKIYKKARSVLEKKINKKVLLIGRIAGQYPKPRSSAIETKNGISLPSYRGDIYNSFDFNEKSRESDPNRIIEAYFKSTSTYNFLREKVKDLYISHECLNLNYDYNLTRKLKNHYYCTSAHMLWIGERTRKINEAHVDFLSKIENPIGIKIGNNANIPELIGIIKKINPNNLYNKLILIPRMGFDKIIDSFGPIFKEIQKEKLNALYEIDPMHGNTFTSESGFKTRDCEHIIKEINNFASNFPCNGLHIEMTGENVTECIGGYDFIKDKDLNKNYKTYCDPRLNPQQLIYILENSRIS